MAAQSEVMKEYLLALGFRVDPPSARAFDTTLNKFDKRVFNLAKGVLGVGAASAVMVTQFARSMERLYYTSRLAESTGARLQAAAFGAKQIGIDGKGMQQMIVGVASALRANPGLNGLLQSLGVRVEGRDKADVLTDLVGALKSMPPYIAQQYAGLFGISPNDLLLLTEGLDKFKEATALRQQMAASAGLDVDKATVAGLAYSRGLNEIIERSLILKDVLAIKLLPAFQMLGSEFNGFLSDLTKVINSINSVNDLGDRFMTGLRRVVGPKLWGFLNSSPGGGAAAPAGIPAGNSTAGAGRGSVNPALVNPGNLPLGLRQNNPGNLRSWGSTPVQGGFAAFGSAQEGLSAMAGNLLAYQRRGLTSLNKIISAWAPSSENNTDAYIKAVSKQTGFGATDLLNMNDPKVLTALMGSIIKHEQGYNPFSNNDLMAAASSRLGGVTIQQSTQIHVTSPDPMTAAKQVAAAQDSVNANLTRNAGQQIVR